jgi:hypothetical protein
MKAIVYTEYGRFHVLYLKEVDKRPPPRTIKSWSRFMPPPAMQLTGIS